MNIVIIVGSQQSESQSSKISTIISYKLKGLGHKTSIIDLGKQPIPFYTDSCNPDTDSGRGVRSDYQQILKDAQGIVVISPEYNGSVPGALKNFFLRCEDGEIAHKPGLLIGVSSGTGGAYPIAELRMSSYKNTKICYIPDHLILRDVGNILNENNAPADDRINTRIDKTIAVFELYCTALQAISEQEIIKNDTMPYGM